MGNNEGQEFGSREVLNMVAKDILTKKPKVYFDYLKATQLTNKTSTVYARGGQGNPQLIGWTGNRETTFNCEDALFSAKNLGLYFNTNVQKGQKFVNEKDALFVKSIPPGVTAPTGAEYYVELGLDKNGEPIHGVDLDSNDHLIYVFKGAGNGSVILTDEASNDLEITASTETTTVSKGNYVLQNYTPATTEPVAPASSAKLFFSGDDFVEGDTVIVDYYYNKNLTEVSIDADKYAGTYYWEGQTLFRDQDGYDHNAHIIIPKGKLIADTEFVFKPDGDPATYKFDIQALKPTRDQRIIIMQIEDEIIAA
ncbi:hypothetical protein ACFHWD_04085 [Clostridium sp. MT-14]|uniref:hypothetical protein n=1 Tax=Clostridium sp. MT-14 TaxID=3348360 RepID=UPI0035F3EE34